jgi:hypothetical protein
MAQFARPSQDITRGSWVTDSGATANLWAALDELAPGDDADFVQSSLATQNDTYEFRLSTVQAALIDRLHLLRYRGRKGAVGGNTRNLTVELRQGATLIASNIHNDLTAVMADGAIVLTKEQGALITDYTDLRVRLIASGTFNGGAAQRRRVEVSWCQFRVPDWQPTWEVDWGAEEVILPDNRVQLTLNGITVEGADSIEARRLLAEAIRDTIVSEWTPPPLEPSGALGDPMPPRPDASVYDDPAYRVWGFLRQPLAYYHWKVQQNTALGIAEKVTRCQARVDELAPLEYQ